ncbi:MAG: nucleotide pyrophosphohydrolase [Bacteroidetes bacterium]|nr:nucleotide pyrophosphohydrolase [Bacteroidota bacterium]
MTTKEIEKQIISFRDERNWEQFHSLKDLLLGLNIECAELSELFLWKSEEEIEKIPKEKIEQELADIFIFLNYISHHFDIDLEKAVTGKLKLNAEKYPVEKSFGSNKKYDQL